MLCSSLGKSLMTACVRHRWHPEIQYFQGRQGRMPPCAQLSVRSHAHMVLHTSNSCRWKPPSNDHRRDQLKAANVCVRLRERGGERGNAEHVLKLDA